MGKGLNVRSKEIYIILAVLFIATAALVYVNLAHSAYSKILDLNTGSVMSLEESTYIFGKTTEGIIACGNDGLTAIGSSGNVLWKYSSSANNPILSCDGAYALHADAGGFECVLVSGGNEVCRYKSTYEIITARVNRTGYFTVVSKERGYKSQVAVISPAGERVYTWHSANYYVIDAVCHDNNRCMFVSVLDTDSGGNMYKLLYFSFDDTQPRVLDTDSGNLVAALLCRGGNILAIGDTEAYGFDKSGRKIFEINYRGRGLQEYAAGDSFLALGLTKSSVDGYYTGSVLEVYGFGGKLRGSYEIFDEITFLDASGNKILVNSENGAYILSNSCHLYGDLSFENEVREGLIFDDGRKLMLVNGSKVNIYNSK